MSDASSCGVETTMISSAENSPDIIPGSPGTSTDIRDTPKSSKGQIFQYHLQRHHTHPSALRWVESYMLFRIIIKRDIWFNDF